MRTDESDARFVRGAVLATDPPTPGPLTIRSVRPQGRQLLVSFEEVSDRLTAASLRNVLLVVESVALPPAGDEDEFRDHELIDLVALHPGGQVIGRVVDVMHLPAQEVLVVRTERGGEVLVPFVAAIVPQVSVEDGSVVIDPPAGLLEEE